MKVLKWDNPLSQMGQVYIPHGSDESLNDAELFKVECEVYIPHGSDERQVNPSWYGYAIKFISHMVQMKEQALRANYPHE